MVQRINVAEGTRSPIIGGRVPSYHSVADTFVGTDIVYIMLTA